MDSSRTKKFVKVCVTEKREPPQTNRTEPRGDLKIDRNEKRSKRKLSKNIWRGRFPYRERKVLAKRTFWVRRIRAHVGDDVSDENGERVLRCVSKTCGHMWQRRSKLGDNVFQHQFRRAGSLWYRAVWEEVVVQYLGVLSPEWKTRWKMLEWGHSRPRATRVLVEESGKPDEANRPKQREISRSAFAGTQNESGSCAVAFRCDRKTRRNGCCSRSSLGDGREWSDIEKADRAHWDYFVDLY